MKRYVLMVTLLLSLSQSLSALLPPFYETRGEIQTILKDPRLQKATSYESRAEILAVLTDLDQQREITAAQPIIGIKKTATGYEVRTNRTAVQMALNDKTRAEIQDKRNDSAFNEPEAAGEPIESIEKNAAGYEIRTKGSDLQAEVRYLKQTRPGPRRYDLDFYPIEKK